MFQASQSLAKPACWLLVPGMLLGVHRVCEGFGSAESGMTVLMAGLLEWGPFKEEEDFRVFEPSFFPFLACSRGCYAW